MFYRKIAGVFLLICSSTIASEKQLGVTQKSNGFSHVQIASELVMTNKTMELLHKANNTLTKAETLFDDPISVSTLKQMPKCITDMNNMSDEIQGFSTVVAQSKFTQLHKNLQSYHSFYIEDRTKLLFLLSEKLQTISPKVRNHGAEHIARLAICLKDLENKTVQLAS
ncbi:MAG TPA: hypothetical protein VEK38_00530, partial [Candidatus Bathyarchaeia archaeon]|nr:hypothetical protein [Candidatus Bathyarchaeia archaeon]